MNANYILPPAESWSYPRPIVSVSPTAEILLTIGLVLFVIGGLIYAWRISRHYSHYEPILIMTAGVFLIAFEPIGDILAHVVYHRPQLVTVITSFDLSIPGWMIACYIGLTVQSLYVMRLIASGVTAAQFMKKYFLLCFAIFVFELPLLMMEFAEYYEPQAYRILDDYPFWLAFVNASAWAFIPGTVLYFVIKSNVLRGPRVVLLVPVTIMTNIGAWTATGWPIGLAHNGTKDVVILNICGALSVALAITAAFTCALLAEKERRQMAEGA